MHGRDVQATAPAGARADPGPAGGALPLRSSLPAQRDSDSFFEPLAAWRTVLVRQRRTRLDWAACLREVLDTRYAEAETVVLVMDNLNTHELASPYKAFAPSEARRLAGRLEIHYTPEHGSWLNMAEVEQSVLARQALSRRLPDREAMERVTTAWYEQRNAGEASVDWQFTAEDARIHLKRLYPKIEH